jgi:hypothetical protein
LESDAASDTSSAGGRQALTLSASGNEGVPGVYLENGERVEVDCGVSPEPVDLEISDRGSSRKRPGRESKHVSVGSFGSKAIAAGVVIIVMLLIGAVVALAVGLGYLVRAFV